MGMSFEEAIELRKSNPDKYISLSKKTIVEHVKAMLEFQKRGAITFDYGNNIRGEAKENGVKMLLIFRVLFPNLFVRFSATEKVLSDGLHFQEIQRYLCNR